MTESHHPAWGRTEQDRARSATLPGSQPGAVTHSGETARGAADLPAIELAGVVKEFQYTNPHSWLLVDVTDKNGKVSTAWVDQKLLVPIKSVSSEGATLELTNVKEGAPPAATFELPAGYTKMDLGGMMGGRKPPQ